MVSIITKTCTRGSDGSDEERAALKLKKWFEHEFSAFPDVKGNLYLLNSIRMFGEDRDDIDILVIGFFENLTFDNIWTKNHGVVDKLHIQSFISNIEIKSHPSDKIEMVGTDYYVKYRRNVHPSCVSVQCKEAKFALVKHLQDKLGLKSHVCDIIWFDNITETQLSNKRTQVDNALPISFSFRRFIDTILLQTDAFDKNGEYFINTFGYGKNRIQEVINHFTEVRVPQGLTKKKFEILSQQSTEIDQIAKTVGQRLTILTGRAGTGKTMQLLQLAFKLASSENSNRCLILTYNKALVSDIRRLIDYTPMPSKVNGRTVSIQTVHSFFHGIFKDFDLPTDGLSPCNNNYDRMIHDLHEKLFLKLSDLCKTSGKQSIKDSEDYEIDWDYIFIDEAQDFSDYEKMNLFKLYGPNRMIIADGVDQFIRNTIRQEWDKGIDSSLIEKPATMTLERRQKVGLVRFINAFAKLTNLDWEVTENDTLTGGYIKIIPEFRLQDYWDLRDICIENEAENYDILILQPPTQVAIDDNGNRYFSKADTYINKAKIPIFDGIDTRKRDTYPSKDQCRVYQYDSCRGLEGWCVVCADFDELIQYKINTYKDTEPALGLDQDLNRKRYAYLWALMPLTRAVDRLVITLKDSNSETGIILKQLSDMLPDIVEWCL